MKRHIIVALSGGLGNQLFQYAAGRSLSLSLNCDLALDLSWFLGDQNREYGLKNFNLPVNILDSTSRFPFGIEAIKARIFKRFYKTRFGLPVFKEPHFHYVSNFQAINSPVVLDGYFQSDRYFLEHEDQIRRDLNFSGAYPEKCLSVYKKIQEYDAIAVHVRRGDYLSSKKNAAIYHSLSIEYYLEAVKDIAKGLANPHCFIFSDDISWARENLVLGMPADVVDINSGDEVYWDLRLMGACKHFVIANSSLSWWGAWLGKDPQKKVISPKLWFKSNVRDTSDLIPENWSRL
jgi:Glycosyl transferase family 11